MLKSLTALTGAIAASTPLRSEEPSSSPPPDTGELSPQAEAQPEATAVPASMLDHAVIEPKTGRFNTSPPKKPFQQLAQVAKTMSPEEWMRIRKRRMEAAEREAYWRRVQSTPKARLARARELRNTAVAMGLPPPRVPTLAEFEAEYAAERSAADLPAAADAPSVTAHEAGGARE